MQYIANFNQVAEKILNLVVSSSNPDALLEDLAFTIGTSLKVDACIAISVRENVPQSLAIGWWSQEHFPGVENRILQQTCLEVLKQLTTDRVGLHIDKFPDIFMVETSSMIAINCQGQANGALVLLKSPPSPWSEQEQQQLAAISHHIAIACSQIQLQQQVQTQTCYRQGSFNGLLAFSLDKERVFILNCDNFCSIYFQSLTDF